MKKFMFLGILIGGGCGEFRSALKVQRGKCCATSFLDLHETLLRRSVLQLLERVGDQWRRQRHTKCMENSLLSRFLFLGPKLHVSR
jgi:hypothetical protein